MICSHLDQHAYLRELEITDTEMQWLENFMLAYLLFLIEPNLRITSDIFVLDMSPPPPPIYLSIDLCIINTSSKDI